MKSQKNNTKKLTIFVFFILILALFNLNIQDAKAVNNEGVNFSTAVTRLKHLACSMLHTQCDGYKPPVVYFTVGCYSGDVCWNSPSIIGSSADLDTNFPSGLPAIAPTNGGDIRYRCRRQKNAIYCFAFRCKEAEPAGCEQMWRIDYKLQTTPGGLGQVGNNDLNLVNWSATSKCVDMGEEDYHGAKDYRVCNDIHTDDMFPCQLSEPNCMCP